MPSRRLAAFALLCVAALGAGVAGLGLARQRTFDGVERALRQADLQVSGRRAALAEHHWTGISGAGIQIARLELRLLPAPRLRVIEPVIDADAVDLEGLLAARPGPAAAPGPLDALAARLLPALAEAATAELVNGAVRLRGEPLLTGLNGPLWPSPDVKGPDGQLGLEQGVPRAQLRRKIELAWITADATLELRCAGSACAFGLSLVDCMIDEPHLAPGPLPVLSLAAQGQWDRASGDLSGAVELGPLQVAVTGRLQPDPLDFDLHLELADAPLEAVVALFGPRVPEGRRGTLGGTVGLSLDLQGMPLRWSARPRATDLSAEGVIPDMDALRGGPIRWTTAGPDGATRLRETGEGTRGWVPLQASGMVPAAFIAAEDAEFRQHRGYSLSAVQAALDEASAEGGWMQRGGSTITQQLVKNLYLDGQDRSLARKLRELLLALEIDRGLSKERVLALYINLVELGPEIYGVGPAADAYFLKQPARLTAREAAFLASLLPSPRRGHRRYLANDPPDARLDQIIDNMAMMRAIDPQTAARARDEILRLVPPAR
ncbi:MAG: transglycosylase domain-containing protein [Deltaproteobacteria bacterium]|nr:transglycosylase domain-containing protein [Deltaproteobacteria bacterium]